MLNDVLYSQSKVFKNRDVFNISYLPEKFGGGLAENTLNAIDEYEKDTFKYSFNENSDKEKDNKNNKKETNGIAAPIMTKIPTSKYITPAVINTKFNENQTLIKHNQQNNSINRSILDINITAPKNYSTNYSLNNSQNSSLLINVGNQ